MKDCFLIIFTFYFQIIICFGQNTEQEVKLDFETLDVYKAQVIYCDSLENKHIIPFVTTDSLIQHLFTNGCDSSSIAKYYQWASLQSKDDDQVPLYGKAYYLIDNPPVDLRFKPVNENRICFLYYKNKIQLVGIGLTNQNFSIQLEDKILNHNTTLEDYKKMFPNSYNIGMDSITESNYWDDHNVSTNPYKSFYLRTNSCSLCKESGLNPYMVMWHLFFRDGKVFYLFIEVGT